MNFRDRIRLFITRVLYYEFWPFWLFYTPMYLYGAFLALSNKIALLQRLAPQRRFEHCDLGVRDEFDMDCIRCNRCLSARDTHLMHKRNP